MSSISQKGEELSFQILISSTDNSLLSINNHNYLIINQLLDKNLPQYDKTNLYNYYEKGISKSRNRALEHASANICLISDDDLLYKPNIEEKILAAFRNNPEADIITFQIDTPSGAYYKDYPDQKFWHTSNTLMNVSSVEIAFRRETIIQKQLYFDERFGLGATFPTGEEFIFLSDALKKGLNILYVPKVIVTHPQKDWNESWSVEEHIKSKGALLYRVFGWKAFLHAMVLSFKKYPSSSFSFTNYLRLLINGMKAFRKIN